MKMFLSGLVFGSQGMDNECAKHVKINIYTEETNTLKSTITSTPIISNLWLCSNKQGM